MGLSLPGIRLLAREHARAPFTGRVLTLGRQFVYATHAQVLQVMQTEGVEPAVTLTDPRTNIPAWIGTGRSRNLSDVDLFRMLGASEVLATDISSHESPDFVMDLGKPLTAAHSALVGSFDLLLDGGTVEHVFDVPQALRNICALLKPGGRVFHISPSCNYMDHGFYSFSPTLFFHYYWANHFIEPHAWLLEHSIVGDTPKGWLYEYDPSHPLPEGGVPSNQHWVTCFVAQKTEASVGDAVPIQGQLPCLRQEVPLLGALNPHSTLGKFRAWARSFEDSYVVSRPWLLGIWRATYLALRTLKRGSRYPVKRLGRL